MASLIFFVGLTCLRLTDHPILKRKGAIHMVGDIVGTIGEFVKLIIETVQKFTQK
ncbi:delta-lysin family phenol-soluble modulin [Staphylococcus simulans]|uniref:delta-lysin family phenol-soluble modulin n=1 Tax=Staphylococcus simulans TaxID=1286 RepID=UPI0015F8E20E|nr:delta-lysin family phenol-soluble modulin [Staphylococcus simulans]